MVSSIYFNNQSFLKTDKIRYVSCYRMLAAEADTKLFSSKTFPKHRFCFCGISPIAFSIAQQKRIGRSICCLISEFCHLSKSFDLSRPLLTSPLHCIATPHSQRENATLCTFRSKKGEEPCSPPWEGLGEVPRFFSLKGDVFATMTAEFWDKTGLGFWTVRELALRHKTGRTGRKAAGHSHHAWCFYCFFHHQMNFRKLNF